MKNLNFNNENINDKNETNNLKTEGEGMDTLDIYSQEVKKDNDNTYQPDSLETYEENIKDMDVDNEDEKNAEIETSSEKFEVDSIKEVKEDFFEDIIKPKESSINSSMGKPGVITIISSEKYGRRLSFPKNIIQKLELELEEKVELTLKNKKIYVGRRIPNSSTYNLKKSGGRKIIYSAPLVEQILEINNLDFSNKTSQTFYNVNFLKFEDDIIAEFDLD